MGGSEWISIASVHGTAILQLQWSQLGTRLACLDQVGVRGIILGIPKLTNKNAREIFIKCRSTSK